MHVQSIIELLTDMKNEHMSVLTSNEYKALSEAINILQFRFNGLDIAEVLISDYVSGICTSRSEIGDKLHEKGFLGNDANIDILIKKGLAGALEDNMLESMWDTIEDYISKNSKELEKR